MISTIDVYGNVNNGGDEGNLDAGEEPSHAYGRHRRWFEQQMRAHFGTSCTIIRLPALFGPFLKKNYLYDLCNHRHSFIAKMVPNSLFQWYDMEDLWKDIETVLAAGLSSCNLFPEPIETSQIVQAAFPGFIGPPSAHTSSPSRAFRPRA